MQEECLFLFPSPAHKLGWKQEAEPVPSFGSEHPLGAKRNLDTLQGRRPCLSPSDHPDPRQRTHRGQNKPHGPTFTVWRD